ncbi:DUF3987 domain-containing protein [Simiduia sp. 21SJ11W-1]|uniref:YfjI family protein n=1 Tax=Simiduia sp. 21SJ11W-1 TaxID=2909669 RepID=UPI0020A2124C|nr:YfjI family protein [Simiduia sp. 21SJ11W-1]UTA47446.1 DUF3987 domain-containing protein [Simiduia sp. 21SJ11W-1]
MNPIPANELERIVTGLNISAASAKKAAYINALDRSETNISGSIPETDPLRPWPRPKPLVSKLTAEPYPINALPKIIRDAVEEVSNFVKAPNALVAGSALSAISLAGQSIAEVKRAERLEGPTSLYLLTIADSGERKSTCDGFFTQAIRNYERQQTEAVKPQQKHYQASIDAWEAKHAGIKEKIRQQAKNDKPTDDLSAKLLDLETQKPTPPLQPRLLYADATPEALAHNLANGWPSGGVFSAEAGAVFGSHGMSKDSAMRNLALLNVLWDGGALQIDRRTGDSYRIDKAWLTVALQVQESTLRSFFDRTGDLARGTGFLARFLIAWPESTQGKRQFSEAPKEWPALDRFNDRIIELLGQVRNSIEDQPEAPDILTLSPEAKAAWVDYYNSVEGQLMSGGQLYDIRDVASKSADNVARLAALFHLFEQGIGPIGKRAVESAIPIATWHLNESRRFFSEISLSAELTRACKLDCWLIDYFGSQHTAEISAREAQRHGPASTRTKEGLLQALAVLEDLDRVRVLSNGRKKAITINPALLPTRREAGH